MSQQTYTITTCDSCNISDALIDFLEPVFVWYGKEVSPEDTPGALRIDLCISCDEMGIYRCSKCPAIHKHETDCKYLKKPAHGH